MKVAAANKLTSLLIYFKKVIRDRTHKDLSSVSPPMSPFSLPMSPIVDNPLHKSIQILIRWFTVHQWLGIDI